MIAIISSAKTMNLDALEIKMGLEFPSETAKVLQLFPKCVKSERSYRAIDLYNGMAFKSLMRDRWSQDDYEYANKKLYVLSALYGVVKASAAIKPYRLDFSKNGSQLYQIWGATVTKHLYGIDDNILNLASDEFSKIIRPHLMEHACQVRMVDVEFFEELNGAYKKHSTISKKARGLMAGWIVKNRIDSFEDVKQFKEFGYEYLEEKSQENKFIFVRKI